MFGRFSSGLTSVDFTTAIHIHGRETNFGHTFISLFTSRSRPRQLLSSRSIVVNWGPLTLVTDSLSLALSLSEVTFGHSPYDLNRGREGTSKPDCPIVLSEGWGRKAEGEVFNSQSRSRWPNRVCSYQVFLPPLSQLLVKNPLVYCFYMRSNLKTRPSRPTMGHWSY